ncbi:MAG: tyrosine-type recombinase/integrase [Ardenticatenaceae bacterium]|nr:tyrosine-type recombinase/integrase [Anaerolineales bacterium]MCB0015078.1 tyrosine-type recombinase/integrase [Anaerolineales bacterium]MCB9009666.1 tyrosine-type recombinase/integrase [Ardenticatenaceae bacterium]
MVNEIQLFVNWVRRRNSKARTWRDYRHVLNRLLSVTGDKPPGDVTIHDIDNFLVMLVEQGLQASTINRHLATVIAFYTFLADDNPSIICPVLDQRHFLRKPEKLPRSVPIDVQQQFFAVIEDVRDRAMFLLMLRCGLRIAEVANLQLPDLFLADTPPRLRVLGKNSKERTVYLSPQVMTAVSTYLAQRPSVPSTFLFLSYQQDGLSTTAIHKRLMKYRIQAGVHLTAHQLRHSFANDLVDVGVPVTTVQKLMGHAWIATTQRYLDANDHKVQAEFYAAAEQLDQWQMDAALAEDETGEQVEAQQVEAVLS